MKQIITLEKEIAFKTMLGDITSISLEPDLAFINDSEIEGNLIISGTYKMTEASTLEEKFNYKVPVEIMLTTSLLEDKRKVDVNNFTYEIVNEEALAIKVELLIEGLEKIEIEEDDNIDLKEEVRNSDSEEEEIEVLTTNDLDDTTEEVTTNVMSDDIKEEISTVMNDDVKEEVSTVMNDDVKEELPTIKEEVETIKEDTNNKKVMDSIFSAFANTDETYATYSVYILREDDNLEEVITKYKTNREALAEYNDLDNLKVGSKLIITTAIESNDK